MVAYSDPGDWQLFCPFCAAPIGREEGGEDEDVGSATHGHPWLLDSVLLSTGCMTEHGPVFDEYYHERHDVQLNQRYCYDTIELFKSHDSSNRTVLTLDAECVQGVKFELKNSHQHVIAMWIDEDRDEESRYNPYNPTYGGHLFIPLHRACLEVARKYFDLHGNSQDLHPKDHPEGAVVNSLPSLLDLLIKRCDIRGGSTDNSCYPSYYHEEPHTFYMPGSHHFHYYCWDWGDDEVYLTDPIDVPYMTHDILANLDFVDRPEPESAWPWLEAEKEEHETPVTPKQRLDALPQELKAAIYSHLLSSFSDADLQCSYILPQSWWRDALKDRTLFPWLWDLNTDAVDEKERSIRRGREWNWELLARKLSQTDIHEPKNTLLRLPDGLKNRRRMYRLVQEARIGDVESLNSIRQIEERDKIFVRECEEISKRWGNKPLPPLDTLDGQTAQQILDAMEA